jgi:hypothetical protein
MLNFVIPSIYLNIAFFFCFIGVYCSINSGLLQVFSSVLLLSLYNISCIIKLMLWFIIHLKITRICTSLWCACLHGQAVMFTSKMFHNRNIASVHTCWNIIVDRHRSGFFRQCQAHLNISLSHCLRC